MVFHNDSQISRFNPAPLKHNYYCEYFLKPRLGKIVVEKISHESYIL